MKKINKIVIAAYQAAINTNISSKHSHQYEQVQFNKYAFQPCLLKDTRIRNEKDFELYLDKHKNIKWWFKNIYIGRNYFGINCYIAMTTSNQIYIWDTKDGFKYKTARPKAEALNDFCKENNVKGGIIKRTGNDWKVNPGKDFDPNDDKQLKKLTIK